MDTLPAVASLLSSASGGARGVLEAALAAEREGAAAALALVIGTEGSTYVRPGAVALFGDGGQAGWLSGGCLEPEIARRAAAAAEAGRIEWLDIDTRDDEDLFSGSAVGCRGRLHLALLPLAAMPGWQALAEAWRARAGALRFQLDAHGNVVCRVADRVRQWALPVGAGIEGRDAWSVELARPPAVAVLGAGPETPTLMPWLRRLGWMTTLVERRPRWAGPAALADVAVAQSPREALADATASRFDAALVMHHHFELDREALEALAATDIGFVGLLGPVRRREDLFRVLPEAVRTALSPRLRSPVGLDLGGQGPEAIALSIAAQLHAYSSGR